MRAPPGLAALPSYDHGAEILALQGRCLPCADDPDSISGFGGHDEEYPRQVGSEALQKRHRKSPPEQIDERLPVLPAVGVEVSRVGRENAARSEVLGKDDE